MLRIGQHQPGTFEIMGIVAGPLGGERLLLARVDIQAKLLHAEILRPYFTLGFFHFGNLFRRQYPQLRALLPHPFALLLP